MEFFGKTMAVKLRSHLDKYLVADDDQETVRQSRNASSRKARWFVELVEGREDVIRLKSCDGRYLMASGTPFLLGMTGKKILQTEPDKLTELYIQWEPIRDGFQVRLKSWCGKFLRANGGTPPWRNSVTHDEPHSGATQKWILWDVEAVEAKPDSLTEYLSSMSSFSSVVDEVLEAASDGFLESEPGSPLSAVPSMARTPRLTLMKSMSPRLSPKKFLQSNSISNHFRSGMEFFNNAKAVRLRSHHEKYLLAEEDEESVTQDRHGSSKNARWVVELVSESPPIIRLKSSYGRYLTASNQPFLLGMTGRKVLQTLPRRLDSSLEWEPIREGSQVKLKTRYGNFLRANGGLPPWRNSVTHDIPHRTATQDWVLWDVDVIEIQAKSFDAHQESHKPVQPVSHLDSLDFDSSSPSSVSGKSGNFSRQESTDSNVSSPPKVEGRTIFYHVADESGEVEDDVVEGSSLIFKGKGVEQLTQKLREETGFEDIIVCTRSPLNGKLFPLKLQLPPNNANMHVVVVPASSKAARDISKQGVAL